MLHACEEVDILHGLFSFVVTLTKLPKWILEIEKIKLLVTLLF